MIKELMHDPIFLAGKSEEATKEDISVANDLLETLMAHRESCVGMAANMIGVRKRIIAFLDESGRTPTYTVAWIFQISSRTWDNHYPRHHSQGNRGNTLTQHFRVKKPFWEDYQ